MQRGHGRLRSHGGPLTGHAPTAYTGATRGTQGTDGRDAMIATLSMDIARPPASVYATLVDQDTWAALDPALLEITPRGSVAVGMSGTMRRRVAGMRVTNGWTVTELEPGARVGMRLTGVGYELIETTTLEAITGGTRATIEDTLRPTSLGGRLFVAVSGPFIRRDLHARSDRLKALLEATPAT